MLDALNQAIALTRCSCFPAFARSPTPSPHSPQPLLCWWAPSPPPTHTHTLVYSTPSENATFVSEAYWSLEGALIYQGVCLALTYDHVGMKCERKLKGVKEEVKEWVPHTSEPSTYRKFDWSGTYELLSLSQTSRPFISEIAGIDHQHTFPVATEMVA